MKNLLYKELKLCLNPQIIIFALLSCCVAIPSWPPLLGFIYPISGFATIFPRALADKDVEYTSMLPVRKGDVVKGKVSLIVFIQLATILFSIPFAVLKNVVITPNLIAQNLASNPTYDSFYDQATIQSLASYGLLFIAFGIYNIVLFPWYYKNPQKINLPQLISMLACVLSLGLLGTLQFFIPSLYQFDITGWIVQLSILAFGVLSYVILTLLSEKLSEKHFDKVDL